MIIGSKENLKQIPNDADISIGGYRIQRVKSSKSLGLYIDKALTWCEKVYYITKKVIAGLAVLGRIRDLVDQRTL